jgi:exodeoxyribonuclease VII large subunit
MSGDLFDPGRSGRSPERRALVRGPGGWQLRTPGHESYAVSAVNALARELLEHGLPPLWVHGEITGWKRHPNGHCYFTLRDRRAQLRAVMFRLEAQRLPTDPDDGMEVRALGTVTLYEKKGDFQFVVRELEAVRAGGLWRLAFERLRTKLEAEGLLAPERKRAIPRFPTAVGVVTSPVGAALQDILRVIGTRAPWTRVLLSPARVQGEGAALDIARAIHGLDRSGLCQVLIVGRGGGGAEDLWAFNEEVVARAIAASRVPVISAIGHEVDVTIADLVADWRAATPSAAAERAVPDGEAVLRELAALRGRLGTALRRSVIARRDRLGRLASELRAATAALMSRQRDRITHLGHRLDALSPLSALGRGYAVPLDYDGRILRRTADFVRGAPFRLRVVDGSVGCRVDEAAGREEDGGRSP